MKPTLHKLLSAALAVLMLAAPLRVSASEALGHDLDAAKTELHADAALGAGTFWSDTYSDLRQENYVVYTPNERVTPIVTSGETTRSLTTVPAMARELEALGYRVVAGMNGDYYGVQHGVPLGSTMVSGALRNANGDPYYAVGFRADGTALIGDPRLSVHTLVNGGSGFRIFAFNHIRQSEYGVFLYDHGFNDRHTTGTSEPGVDVLCSAVSGRLSIGGQLTLRVDEVLPEATDTYIEEGRCVLTANLRADEAFTAPLLALQPGDEITVSVTSGAGDAWNDVVNMLGAPELLVENGAVRTGLPTGSAPRTAIGQRADGTLIFYTIDGRQAGYSIGATLTAVAMRLAELGCVTAVALDGGGSTTLAATLPNETAARVVNVPSEGGVRAVSNQIFLVASNAPSGLLDHIYLAPEVTRALPGAQIALTAAAIDTNYIPMDVPVETNADKGVVVDNVLTLPDTVGAVTAGARYGGRYATAGIEAAAPDTITLRRGSHEVTSLTLSPGESVSLSAEAYLNHLRLAGGNSCFTWTLDGDAGVCENGVLTAAGHAAAGTLTVSAAGKSAAIPVTVSAKELKTLDGFEQDFAPLISEDGAVTLSRVTDGTRVRYGRAAARLDYASGSPLYVNYPIAAGYDGLTLWVYGGGSGAWLYFAFDNGAASAYIPLDSAGWKQYAIPVPSGAAALTELYVAAEAGKAGTVWLDQLVLTYDRTVDDAPPELTLSLNAETNVLTGRAFDAVDGAALTTLSVAYDGAAISLSFDRATGALAAALPLPDGLAHRATVTAGDASGNLARRSVNIPAAADAAPAFPDTEKHWADSAIEYLKRTGVSNGSGGRYRPDSNITRQEFAVMLYRYLSPAEDFGDVSLPFSDSARIAPWAAEAARAMYALGIVRGSADSGGLNFNPEANISRQEAVTMIGRLLEKGYAAPPLAFTDSSKIPAWSAEHIRVLSAMGVLGGYEDGSFRPAAPMTRAQVASALFRLN